MLPRAAQHYEIRFGAQQFRLKNPRGVTVSRNNRSTWGGLSVRAHHASSMRTAVQQATPAMRIYICQGSSVAVAKEELSSWRIRVHVTESTGSSEGQYLCLDPCCHFHQVLNTEEWPCALLALCWRWS